MAEQFLNEISPALTLATAITSTSSTTITPSSTAALPSSGNFRIRIDDELMKASVSGSNLTVTRGDGGTTAATHAAGSTIYIVVTAEAFNAISTILQNGVEVSNRRALNIIGGIVQDNSGLGTSDIYTGPGIGLSASRPSSPSKGTVYIPTDGILTNIYDGSNWYGLQKVPFTIPPTVANWTTLNTSGSSIVDVPNGGITILPKLIGSGNLVGLYRSIPAHGSAWTRTAYFTFAGTGRCGIFIYDSTTQKCQGYCWLTGVPGLDEIYYTNPTTATTNVNQWNIANISPVIRLRLQDNGTNRIFMFSTDGINWVTMTTESNTNNVTPNYAGFFMDPQSGSIPSIGTLMHWVESSP